MALLFSLPLGSVCPQERSRHSLLLQSSILDTDYGQDASLGSRKAHCFTDRATLCSKSLQTPS